MMPYWPDVKGAPQNSTIGGATLWVLRDRPREEYKGVARFFAYLSQPGVQAAWHQHTGYLPVTRAAFELTRAATADELEQAFAARKSAQAAPDAAGERGNKTLRQSERASPDR